MNKNFLIPIGILAVILAGILVFAQRNSPTAQTGIPTFQVNPILSGLIEDAKRASAHEIPAVAEAGKQYLLLIQQQEIKLPVCPTIRILGNSGKFSENPGQVMLGTIPNLGYDKDNQLVLVETETVEASLWQQIPTSERWSFIWHEMQHVEQDCLLLKKVIDQTGLKGEALWEEFHRRWELSSSENEAFPLAVQAYWHNHGRRITVFPALHSLLKKMPSAWEKTLPISADGIPVGIEQQPEWPAWLKLVEQVYVIK